jgi:type IV pilus assembly protein PilE
MNTNRGFTLIEVMVVVAIIAILAAIAIPNYNDYLTRSRTAEPASVLSDARVLMEQFFQDNRAYGTAGVCGASAAAPQNANFTYSCVLGNPPQSYVWTATGQGPMRGFVYTIDQLNARTSTIGGGAAWPARALVNCWITSRNGC